MGGEYELFARSSRPFSAAEQSKWEAACVVLQDIARFRGFCVATQPDEETHSVSKSTGICSKCQGEKCSQIFLVWNSEGYGGIEVPMELNQTRCYPHYDNDKRFSINGCVKWRTSSFCTDVENTLGYLFPDKFQVTWDEYYRDCGDTERTYGVQCNDADLDKCFPEKFAQKIREINKQQPSLQHLCQEKLFISNEDVDDVLRGSKRMPL